MDARKESSPQIINWRYETRLLNEQLGKDKYSNISTAFSELVSNSFDAEATSVSIKLIKNVLEGVESVEISDNGHGISQKDMENKFSLVGFRNPSNSKYFGKFGVGRFSVFRIGSKSMWSSCYRDESGALFDMSFSMTDDGRDSIEIINSPSKLKSTGTTIQIFNLSHNEGHCFSTKKISDDLLVQFISFLLANPNRKIVVDETAIDPNDLIHRQSLADQEISLTSFGKTIVNVAHINLKKNVPSGKFPSQFLFCTNGKLVTTHELDVSVPKNYIALINCDYFSEIVNSNREALVTMDADFMAIASQVKDMITAYQQTREADNAQNFIEKARSEPYYPFKVIDSSPTKQAEQAIYDVVLEKVHEHADLNKVSKKHREVIFKLVNKAVKNTNLLEVLEEIAELSDEDVEKFKRVLTRTTLQQILKLTDEVSARLVFLDMLHGIVYNEDSKKIKERAHLHKIIEQHPWLFGDKYQLATSDKNFRAIIQKHREKLSLKELPDKDILSIKEYSNIPDLFMTCSRSYPIEPRHHHLIVELKAPRVAIGHDEIEQIRKYANIILKSKEFSSDSVHWDLYLISASVSNDIDMERKQKDRELGLLSHIDKMKIWVFQWSEIIQKAKDELELVRSHLQVKTSELSVAEYIKEEFPFLNVQETNVQESQSASSY